MNFVFVCLLFLLVIPKEDVLDVELVPLIAAFPILFTVGNPNFITLLVVRFVAAGGVLLPEKRDFVVDNGIGESLEFPELFLLELPEDVFDEPLEVLFEEL